MVLGSCGSWDSEGVYGKTALGRMRSDEVGRGMYINDFLRVRRGGRGREGKKWQGGEEDRPKGRNPENGSGALVNTLTNH